MTETTQSQLAPSVVSVNVGAVRTVERGGKMITTGIFKEPVAGRVPLRGVNFDGDDQADRGVHGGHDRAAYAYAVGRLRLVERRARARLRAGHVRREPHDARAST